MPSARQVVGSLALAAVTLAGCSEIPQLPDSGPGDPSNLAATMAPVDPSQIQTFDDLMVEIGERVPGFAGYYLDANEELVMRLTSPQRGARAAQLADVFEQIRPHLPTSFQNAARRVEAAEYTFQELKGWHDALIRRLPVFAFMDVDEVANRVRIGMPDQAGVGRARSLAEELGVPDEAIELSVSPLTRINHHALSQPMSSRMSGAKIAYFNTTHGIEAHCSMGYNLRKMVSFGVDDGHRYFITASHCGTRAQFGVVTPLEFGQPDLGHMIAEEVVDPPLFTDDEHPLCPPGRQCRLSDAAIYRYNSGVTSRHGTVARVPGTHGITPATIDLIGAPPNGSMVAHTGWKTGEQEGVQTHSCVTLGQSDEFGDTGRTMICQRIAGYVSDNGDSGGPVFFLLGNPPQGQLVSAIGQHWGDGGAFSNLNVTLRELGQPSDPFTYPRWEVECDSSSC